MLFNDLINYKDPNIQQAVLNLTNISLGAADIDTSLDVTTTCLDNQIILIGGKQCGIFMFKSKYNIKIQETSYTGDCSFQANVVNLGLTKEFNFNSDGPFIKAKFHIDFTFKDYSVNAKDKNTIKDILESALKNYIENTQSSLTSIVNTKVQSELDNFYKTKYVNYRIMNFTTYQPQQTFNLDFNYMAVPETIRDKSTQKCAIIFKRSGKISGIATPHDSANFSFFDLNQNRAEVFLSNSIFRDIISNITDKYQFRGEITQTSSEILGLPYRMNMVYFSKILPDSLNSYLASTSIEVHWTIYDVRLNFSPSNSKLAGVARLDCTFYSNPDTIKTKQVYSFDADLNFNVELKNQNRTLNFNVGNFIVTGVRVRENYGYSNIGQLKLWISNTISNVLKNNPYNLFEKPLDFSFLYDNEISSKFVADGILIY